MGTSAPRSGWRATLTLVATPSLALAIVVALAVAIELIARGSTVRSRLIPPSVGSRFRLLDQHLEAIKSLTDEGVKLDCVILGNSLPQTGIDPEVLSTAFAERSGRKLECYNLGTPGVRPRGAAALARVVLEDYRPWLVIFGTSARDFSLQTKSPGLEQLPWLRYRSGEITLEGWLVDHSYAYRYYLLYRSWSVPEQRPFVEYRFPISPRGFMKLRRLSSLVTTLDEAAPELKAPLLKQLAKGVSAKQLRGLAELAELEGSKAQMLVVELPASALLTRTLARDAPNYGPIIRRMQSEAERHGVPFWRMPKPGVIPDDGWVDLWHMNPVGAQAYSRWLGHRLADAIASGELAGPPA